MSGRSRTWLALSIAALALVVTASCSSSSPKATESNDTNGAPTTTTPGPYERPACEARPAQEIAATPVAGSTSDFDITSFDGTKIRTHWFPVDDAGSLPHLVDRPRRRTC